MFTDRQLPITIYGVATAMQRAEAEARWADLADMFSRNTSEGDSTRLRVDVLSSAFERP